MPGAPKMKNSLSSIGPSPLFQFANLKKNSLFCNRIPDFLDFLELLDYLEHIVILEMGCS